LNDSIAYRIVDALVGEQDVPAMGGRNEALISARSKVLE
jgi:hypothetical protein